jgi:hypothetical protein
MPRSSGRSRVCDNCRSWPTRNGGLAPDSKLGQSFRLNAAISATRQTVKRFFERLAGSLAHELAIFDQREARWEISHDLIVDEAGAFFHPWHRSRIQRNRRNARSEVCQGVFSSVSRDCSPGHVPRLLDRILEICSRRCRGQSCLWLALPEAPTWSCRGVTNDRHLDDSSTAAARPCSRSNSLASVVRLHPNARAILTTPEKAGVTRPFSIALMFGRPIPAASARASCDMPAAVRSFNTARPSALATTGSTDFVPMGRPVEGRLRGVSDITARVAMCRPKNDT